MLHTKPQSHWPFRSGEKDFWRVFTIYGHGGHLGHVTQTPRINFCSPIPLRLHMKSGFDTPSGFGEDLWKWWMTDGRRRRRRRTDDGPSLYYKLTNEPKGSGELIMLFVPSAYRCYMWNTVRIGLMASEEMSFDGDGHQMPAYKLTYEPSAQVS